MSEEVIEFQAGDEIPSEYLSAGPGESARVEIGSDGERAYYRLVFIDAQGRVKRIVEIRPQD